MSADEARDLALLPDELAELTRRVEELEKLAHKPFDFTDLVRRLERLESRPSGGITI